MGIHVPVDDATPVQVLQRRGNALQNAERSGQAQGEVTGVRVAGDGGPGGGQAQVGVARGDEGQQQRLGVYDPGQAGHDIGVKACSHGDLSVVGKHSGVREREITLSGGLHCRGPLRVLSHCARTVATISGQTPVPKEP